MALESEDGAKTVTEIRDNCLLRERHQMCMTPEKAHRELCKKWNDPFHQPLYIIAVKEYIRIGQLYKN